MLISDSQKDVVNMQTSGDSVTDTITKNTNKLIVNTLATCGSSLHRVQNWRESERHLVSMIAAIVSSKVFVSSLYNLGRNRSSINSD